MLALFFPSSSHLTVRHNSNSKGEFERDRTAVTMQLLSFFLSISLFFLLSLSLSLCLLSSPSFLLVVHRGRKVQFSLSHRV